MRIGGLQSVQVSKWIRKITCVCTNVRLQMRALEVRLSAPIIRTLMISTSCWWSILLWSLLGLCSSRRCRRSNRCRLLEKCSCRRQKASLYSCCISKKCSPMCRWNNLIPNTSGVWDDNVGAHANHGCSSGWLAIGRHDLIHERRHHNCWTLWRCGRDLQQNIHHETAMSKNTLTMPEGSVHPDSNHTGTNFELKIVWNLDGTYEDL